MKRFTVLTSATAILAALTLQGCGPKAYTDGTYDDPNRVALLDDKFNEADMHQMAEKIIDAMLKCPEIKEAKGRPSVAVSKVVTRLEEFPDVDSLTEMIRTELSKSRKVKFIDRSVRQEVDDEVNYNASGRVSKETQKKHGKQVGIDYLMNGSLASNVQQVGNDKLIFYVLTMNLVNTDSTAIDCTERVEVRKKYRKKSLGLF